MSHRGFWSWTTSLLIARSVFLVLSTTPEHLARHPAIVQEGFIDWVGRWIQRPRIYLFIHLLTYLFNRHRIFKIIFFPISNGVKRKETKRNHVKILIHTKNYAFNFQMAYFFPTLPGLLSLF